MRRYSASSLSTAERCLRKWAFKYLENLPDPAGPGAAFGSAFHDRRERYLRGEAVPDIEFEGLPELPLPGTPGLEIERPFDILIRGRWFTGRKDYELPGPIVGDHKTGKEYRYTPGKLAKDPQAALYAFESMWRTGSPHCDLEWIMYRPACSTPCERKHKTCYDVAASRPVRLRLSRDDVTPIVERMVELADTLAMLEEAGAKALDLPPSYDACDDFGGCPYQSVCPREVFPMSDPQATLAEFKAKYEASKGINPPPPPPPKKAPPPPPPSKAAATIPAPPLAKVLVMPALNEDDARGNVPVQSMGLNPAAINGLARTEYLTFALYHEELGRYFRSKCQ